MLNIKQQVYYIYCSILFNIIKFVTNRGLSYILFNMFNIKLLVTNSVLSYIFDIDDAKLKINSIFHSSSSTSLRSSNFSSSHPSYNHLGTPPPPPQYVIFCCPRVPKLGI
jgi:hypothetical protein